METCTGRRFPTQQYQELLGNAPLRDLALGFHYLFLGKPSDETGLASTGCVNLLQALILNRITVYASTRQRIFLTWEKRLALRLIPILLFMTQIRSLLCAIQCQTSPDFSLYRYGDADKYNPLDWSSDSGFFYKLSSSLTLSSDSASCAAVGMSRAYEVRPRYGSFSLLWPAFLRLSLSHLIETLSCALQQQPVMTDVGMSVFEHSLAFAETETMISQILGVGLFRSSSTATQQKASNMTQASTSSSIQVGSDMARVPTSATNRAILDLASSLTGPHLLDRLNVPVEVLLVALLSSCNSLTANVIAVFNRQRSLRLLNTGFWGICFISAFIWGFWNVGVNIGQLSRDSTSGVSLTSVSGLLLFPTVCIVGFVPHLLVLAGIAVCASIYLLALLFTACSLSTNPLIQLPEGANMTMRLRLAHDNLQATIQLRNVNIRWHEDFYTALLRVGFVALTAASEAVFFNEGRSVEARRFTWLEEERLDELETSGTMMPTGGHHRMTSSNFQIFEEYGVPPGGPESPIVWESGYAKEHKLSKEKTTIDANGVVMVYPQATPDGVGAIQRSTRFYLLLIFVRGIYYLIGGWLAFGIGELLDLVGVTGRPPWLRSIVGKSLKQEALNKEENAKREKSSGSGFCSEDLELFNEQEGTGTDDDGDYLSSSDLEDTTSVLSMSSVASTGEPEDDEGNLQSDSEGYRTPTQHNYSRESTPIAHQNDLPLDAATLARLLNPPDTASRDEARIMAAHLAQEDARIMTRSKYRQEIDRQRSRILFAGRSVTGNDGLQRPLSLAEEAESLESLVISRRQKTHSNSQPTAADREEGVSASPGPSCVICQSQARTIITWPCRCLCVCEDCRVSLALNNFDKCVTCRREVSGFVRLWMP